MPAVFASASNACGTLVLAEQAGSDIPLTAWNCPFAITRQEDSCSNRADVKSTIMANFKTHISASSLLGIGYGGAAYMLYDVPLPTCVLAGGLCGVSGMLPDLDSGPSVPLRESVALAAAVVPIMLIDRFQQMGITSPELIVLAGALVYLLIRFGLAAFLRKYTVHRGMFHSLPAALIFGELAFLLASGDDVWLRIYKAGGVVVGYLSHLALDELYSIEWARGRLRLKKSFGTALKVFGRGWWPNISTYLKLAVLTFIALKEPGWMQQHYKDQVRQPVEQTAANMLDRIIR